jgi:hypothetical protein
MTKTADTLDFLLNGWFTSYEMATVGGCLSLSQRCGEFKKEGWEIRSEYVITHGGARVLSYHCPGRVED